MEREELLRRYALLCDRLPEGEALAEMDAMRGAYYRTKSYRSGTLLEIEAYPLLPARQREQVKRIQPTSEAQRKLNQRNAEKRMIRLDRLMIQGIETGHGELSGGKCLYQCRVIHKFTARRIQKKRTVLHGSKE